LSQQCAAPEAEPSEVMELLVVLEDRFLVSPDGATWGTTARGTRSWDQLLAVFEEVRFAARATDTLAPPAGSSRVDTSNARLVPMPMFRNPLHLVARYRAVRRALGVAIDNSDAVLLKVPGTLANLALPILLRTDRTFGVNVVGDPAEVLRGPVGPALFRPLVRRWFVRRTRHLCRKAAVAIYVSGEVLPLKYPPGPSTETTYVSNVHLEEDSIRTSVPEIRTSGTYQLVTVAALEQAYKGVDVLIRAIADLTSSSSIAIELTIIGDGRTRSNLESLSRALNVNDRVRFVGMLPGSAEVREAMSDADLFVLASRTEGLPRALVEAMALGLPSIGTSVGGIPELLPPEDRIAPDDADALAALIAAVLGDPTRRAAMSRRNLATAEKYRASVLWPRLRAAYTRLAEKAADH
jgi:phosphatidyl-myo-inositol dimannoside synthase